MKKVIAGVLSLAMFAGMAVGCSSDEATSESDSGSAEQVDSASEAGSSGKELSIFGHSRTKFLQ